MSGPLAGAGGPGRRSHPRPVARRIGSWLIWWVLLMAFWVWVDDSILFSELLVGAGVACLGATLVELVQNQARSQPRIRIEWVAPVVRLPFAVVRDTLIVYGAIVKTVVTGQAPPSRFEEVEVDLPGDTPEAVTHRALVIGGTSVAPNTFALGIDPDEKVMVVHHLVPPSGSSQ